MQPEPSDRPADAPKVFVSYSRKDLTFVDRLDAELRAYGIEPLIDRQEIEAFEDWWQRIQDLIAKADTVIFVLSPDAVASEVCRKEVDFAGSLNKRFAPIVAKAVDPALVPEALRRLNFIHLDREAAFEQGVLALVDALSTDLDWVRRHSEFGEMARRWTAAGRPGPHGMLLRSPILEEAERWIAGRPANAPVPTEETQALILASRRSATRGRNQMTALLACGLVAALLLSGFALWQRQVARANETEAIAARKAETEQRGLAETRERQAVEAGNRTLTAQSRFLADAASRNLDDGDPGTAVLLSLEALPDEAGGRSRPVVPEALKSLDRASSILGEVGLAARHVGTSLAFSSDGRWAVSSGGGEQILVDVAAGSVSRSPLAEGMLLAFAPEGGKLLRCSGGGIDLVDLSSGWTQSVVGAEGVPEGEQRICLFSRDGHRITSASERDLASWDLRSGQPLARFTLPEGASLGTPSEDGRLIPVVLRNGTVGIHDIESGREVAVLEAPGARIEHVALSSDGRRAVTAGPGDGTVRIWEVGSARVVREIRSPALPLLSPDGRRLVLRGRQNRAGIGGGFDVWDAGTGERLASSDPSLRLTSLEFDRDGGRLVGGGADGTIRLFDTATAKEIGRLSGHQSRVISAALSPDGRRALSTSFDSRLVLWTLSPSRPAREMSFDRSPVVAMAPLDQGTRMLGASEDGVLRLRDLRAETMAVIPLARGAALAALALDPAGARALAVRRDGHASLVDLRSSRIIEEFEAAFARDGVEKGAVGAVFSPDGARLVVSSRGAVSIRQSDDGRVVRRIPVDFTSPGGAAFTADGRRVLAWSSTGVAAVIDVESGSVLQTLRNVPLGIDGRPMPAGQRAAGLMPWEVIEVSADGRFLATAGMLQPRIWDLDRGQLVSVLIEHEIVASAGLMRFSPDGRTLFTVERHRNVAAWDVASGMRTMTFSGHAGTITSLRVGADGRRLLTASEDGTARIWDVASGIDVVALRGQGGRLRDARFWPDGQIATASSEGTVRLWSLAATVQAQVDGAKERMTRCLTPAQRRRVYLDPEPPAWCVTGPGLEQETDRSRWQPRPPYHMPIWQRWYGEKQAGRPIGLPRLD
ncbi:toll/interleukin-1 receptor domain-containing protein [Enterovirga rhinocerotis]|uniref:WD40 repeat protein n=1 Tax=Enterovirga rhinocerotis TaxID=1339210 RepID=A0A4R7BRJ7_9HYPH|nr:TIR domain-containing protein [Enterovirga rhinocerotis]TDR88011.1 WD40 repeat protein [Enterovirga rhinocerotis]